MVPLIILGAGTMAQEVTDLVADIGNYEVIGYAVDRAWQPGMKLLDRPVWRLDQLPAMRCQVVGAMFSPERRGFIERIDEMGYDWATIIHPSASVSKIAEIKPGTVINRLAVVAAYARIGRHVLVNRGALIGHHTVIGDYTTLAPGVNLAGRVRVGIGALVGMGVIVPENRTIGNGVFVRAGTLVTGDIGAE